jgi:4-hydroxy-tetrahydrodipicolinate synthase
MAKAALDGDFDTAATLQIEMLPLIEALFSEVNPIPVKAAMKLLGYDCGECRLPLTPLTKKNYDNLQSLLAKAY